MGWRGPAALVLLVLLGVALGYGASLASTATSPGSGVAEPVVAHGPRHPGQDDGAPDEGPVPDPVDPPLPPDVPLTVATMGTGRFAISFPVPAGWTANQNATNEAKWKEPGTSNNTYVLRVEQITSQDLTIPEAIRQRVRMLREEQPEMEVLSRGEDSLEYTYISDEGTFRHSFMRWLDIDGSDRADVEVVVHGRERDVAGTRDLVEEVAAGMAATPAP